MATTSVTNVDVKALFSFLENKRIDYVLTGSCGLYYHGALPKGEEAHDIDVIILPHEEGPSIYKNEKDVVEILLEQQNLSGCTNDDYRTQMFTFKVGPNNVKVNAFIGNVLCNGVAPNSCTMKIENFTVKVHSVKEILQAKFSVCGRKKDHLFFAKMINQLSNLFSNV